jgi:hypothetical protein
MIPISYVLMQGNHCKSACKIIAAQSSHKQVTEPQGTLPQSTEKGGLQATPEKVGAGAAAHAPTATPPASSVTRAALPTPPAAPTASPATPTSIKHSTPRRAPRTPAPTVDTRQQQLPEAASSHRRKQPTGVTPSCAGCNAQAVPPIRRQCPPLLPASAQEVPPQLCLLQVQPTQAAVANDGDGTSSTTTESSDQLHQQSHEPDHQAVAPTPRAAVESCGRKVREEAGSCPHSVVVCASQRHPGHAETPRQKLVKSS